jgi:hypothetical protein
VSTKRRHAAATINASPREEAENMRIVMIRLATFTTAALTGAVAGVAMLVSGAAFAASPSQCRSYATDYANRAAPPQGQIITGIIGGAGVGALIGGIAGGSKGAGTGAAIGGTVGGAAGVAARSAKWNNAYNHAYSQCMGGSAAYIGAPEPWTPQWYEYCEAKYRSFNPADGKFQPYSGPRRLCR